MAPVVAICGLKGGVGKTCTSIALATAAAADGQTLLVDADPNGSALRWHRRGEEALPFDCVPIQQAMRTMQRKDWQTIFVDTAGGVRDEQAEYANGSSLVICPAMPSASSLEQVLDLCELIKPTGVQHAVLLTMCDSRRKQDATRARKLLQTQGIEVFDTTVSLLSCWPKAEAAGSAIADARTDDGRVDPGASKAWGEISALYAEVLSRINAGQQLPLAA